MAADVTMEAILGVLKQRQAIIDRMRITGKGYRLTPEERGGWWKKCAASSNWLGQPGLQLRGLQDKVDALEPPPTQLALPPGLLDTKQTRQAARGAVRPTGRGGKGEGRGEPHARCTDGKGKAVGRR